MRNNFITHDLFFHKKMPVILMASFMIILAIFSIISQNYGVFIFALLLPIILIFLAYMIKNPYVGILFILASYMFRFRFDFGFITSNIIVVAICFSSIIINKKEIKILIEGKIVFTFIIFFSYMFSSYYFSHGEFSYYEINGFINNFILLFLFFLFNTEAKIEAFYKVLVWCSVILAVMGFWQIISSGMPENGMTGFFNNHVGYALRIACGLPFCYYLIKKNRGRIYYFFLFLLLAGVLLALSRGVFMALIGAGILGYITIQWSRLSGKGRLKYLGAGCFVFVFAIITLYNLPAFDWFGTNQAREVSSGRTVLYQAAWNIFEENPVLGIGWERFRSEWSDYSDLRRPRHGRFMGDREFNVHSSYLKILAELGLLGFALFLFLNFFLWKSLARVSLEGLGVPLFLTLLIFYFHGLVDNTAYFNDRLFYLVWGLLFSVRELRRNETMQAEELESDRQQPLATNLGADT